MVAGRRLAVPGERVMATVQIRHFGLLAPTVRTYAPLLDGEAQLARL